jgi:transposase
LRHRLGEWIEATRETGHARLARIANRLVPHIESVIAGSRHKVRPGLVESVNSKIAALRVPACGYRDPEPLKLDILQRCSLPDGA